MPGPAPSASWRITTPTSAPGGVAAIQLSGDIDIALAALGIKPVPTGAVALRSLAGIDTGLVARWTPSMAQLMPHAGRAVVRRLADQLTAAGLPEVLDPDPRILYPEAADEVEARMLATLARAASPLAIDLLLQQPARWRAMGSTPHPLTADDAARANILNRLIDPPLVVMLGASNIGKSTLTNALAGNAVSIVADEPGTTRDHVGVMIDMAGLVVRFVDTPGFRPGASPIETEAAQLAMDIAAKADLVLLPGDATAEPLHDVLGLPVGVPSLMVHIRSDLGPVPWPHDVTLSALQGSGLTDLAQAIRDRLVPLAIRQDPRPWKFWT